MTDDMLEHCCKLSVVMVGAIRSDGLAAELSRMNPRELRDHHTCLKIMADAFVELMNRQGIKPRFKMPSGAA